MNASEKYIKNTVACCTDALAAPTNTPEQYASRQKQYMAQRTRKFNEHRAYLATDYTVADVQGLTEDFYEYTTKNIRLADATLYAKTAFDEKLNDDWKSVLFADESITYFPRGAKLVTMGSTWICVNSINMSGANAKGTICRCNATYNSYDEYGNVVTEPIIIRKMQMQTNANVGYENTELVAGLFNVVAQKNANTEKLFHNRRIVVGTQVYYITGFTDFEQEFTGDRDSARILTFTMRLEEPTVDDDVTDNFIAGGNTYSFSAALNGQAQLKVNTDATFAASFIVNGKAVTATDDMPFTWQYTSSDDDVVHITHDGIATAKKSGTAVITATLKQNPDVAAYMAVQAVSVITDTLEFDEPIQTHISQYDTALYSVSDGTKNPVTAAQWTFSGASERDYCYTVDDDGNLTVTCKSASATPLIITAKYNGLTVSTSVILEGY